MSSLVVVNSLVIAPALLSAIVDVDCTASRSDCSHALKLKIESRINMVLAESSDLRHNEVGREPLHWPIGMQKKSGKFSVYPQDCTNSCIFLSNLSWFLVLCYFKRSVSR